MHNEPTGASESLARLEMLGNCMQAISELVSPDQDFQHKQRANLSLLLGFIAEEQAKEYSSLQQTSEK